MVVVVTGGISRTMYTNTFRFEAEGVKKTKKSAHRTVPVFPRVPVSNALLPNGSVSSWTGEHVGKYSYAYGAISVTAGNVPLQLIERSREPYGPPLNRASPAAGAAEGPLNSTSNCSM
jgi:hypothetical protein